MQSWFLLSEMMTLPPRIDNERLRSRMSEFGLTQSALAAKIGVSQATIGKLAVGLGHGSKHLSRIARILETTPEYLTGETDDPREGALPVPSAELIAEHLDSVLIPEIDIAYSMGGGAMVAEHERSAFVPFPREWLRPIVKGSFEQVFVARGEGDSMMPTLLDGDVIIVDRSQNAIDRQDRLWAITYGELGMVKRVRRLPDGGYQINSDNPAVTAITAYDDEMHVVGRVVWIGRRV